MASCRDAAAGGPRDDTRQRRRGSYTTSESWQVVSLGPLTLGTDQRGEAGEMQRRVVQQVRPHCHWRHDAGALTDLRLSLISSAPKRRGVAAPAYF